MIAVRSKRRKKTFTKQRAVWIAYVRPDDRAEFPEPEFKVIAPASWKKEKVLRTLWDKGVEASFLFSLHMDLAIRMEKTRKFHYDWVSAGDEFRIAWEDTPRKLLHLPSGRIKVFPDKEREYFRRVRNFLPSYPQVEISTHYYEEAKGLYVLRVYANGIHRHIFRWNFRAFSSTVHDFMPVGCLCDFIDNGYEVSFGPVFDAEAVRVVCKLIENIAKRLIRKGFLSYRCDRKSRKPLPKYYLRFITQDELQILQSLMRD
jgi:hypothetical protein